MTARRSEAFLKEEIDSRLRTKTSSSGNDYFDQVVAMSQSMINAAFKDIHEKNDSMKEIKVQTALGSLVGTIEPCTIIVQGGTRLGNPNKVIWRMSFTSGTLTMNQFDGPPISLDISGWVIGVEVDLGVKKLIPTENDDEDAIEKKDKEFRLLKQIYNVPENYNPSRLYAQLSTAYGKSFSTLHSTFGKRKVGDKEVEIKEADFRKLSAKHNDYLDFLAIFLRQWAKSREDEGLTVMGTQFEYEGEIPAEKQASYPPTSMTLHTSPYLLSLKGDTEWPEGFEGIEEPGSRNCLCYCQLVEGRTLSDKGAYSLPYWGNWATLGQVVDENNKALPGAINGTFSLSRQLFFEKVVLPAVHNLICACQIQPVQATYVDKGRGTAINWTRTYGADLSTIKDIKFKMLTLSTGEPSLEYTVDPIVHVVDSKHYNSTSMMNFLHVAKSSSYVKVRWAPGEKNIIVSGTSTYDYKSTAGQKSERKENEDVLTDYQNYLEDKFLADWSFQISLLKIVDGDLQMEVSKSLDVNVTNPVHKYNEGFEVPAKQLEDIKVEMTAQLKGSISHITDVLNQAFKTQFKFTYPGSGQLDFNDIVFSNNGDVLAEIEYKAVAPGMKITIPDAIASLTPPPVVQPTTGRGASSGLTVEDTQLTWEVDAQAAAANSSKQPIVVIGTNNGDKNINLNSLQLFLNYAGNESGPLPTSLFTSKVFVGSTSSTTDPANRLSYKEEPQGAIKLGSFEIVTKRVSTKSPFTRCTMTISPRTGAKFVTFPPGGQVIIEVEAETGSAGGHKVAVCEYVCDETGTPLQGTSGCISETIAFTLEAVAPHPRRTVVEKVEEKLGEVVEKVKEKLGMGSEKKTDEYSVSEAQTSLAKKEVQS